MEKASIFPLLTASDFQLCIIYPLDAQRSNSFSVNPIPRPGAVLPGVGWRSLCKDAGGRQASTAAGRDRAFIFTMSTDLGQRTAQRTCSICTPVATGI